MHRRRCRVVNMHLFSISASCAPGMLLLLLHSEEVGGAAVLSPRSGRACRSREREGQEKACSRKRQAFRFFFPVVSESLKGFNSFHFFFNSSCFSPLFPSL